MAEVTAITGRKYSLFDYVGHPQADRVIVMMGSGSQIVEEAVNYLTAQGQRVGLVKVRLFRPWSAEHLMAALPATATKIAVLDRTKESGSAAEPLYLDVMSAITEADAANAPRRTLVNGRFGLGSKEFTPSMAVAVFDNLSLDKPKRGFTVSGRSGRATDPVHFGMIQAL